MCQKKISYEYSTCRQNKTDSLTLRNTPLRTTWKGNSISQGTLQRAPMSKSCTYPLYTSPNDPCPISSNELNLAPAASARPAMSAILRSNPSEPSRTVPYINIWNTKNHIWGTNHIPISHNPTIQIKSKQTPLLLTPQNQQQ